MATEFEIKLRAGNVRQLEKILKDPQVAGRELEKLREMHMKTPGSGYARGEWECEGDSPEAAIETLIGRGAPEELRELSAPGLQMVCGASFIRLTQPLRLSGKTTCEICADGGELLGGKRREPFCELELELSRGSENELLAFSRALASKYFLAEEQKSKFVRARRLADGK